MCLRNTASMEQELLSNTSEIIFNLKNNAFLQSYLQIIDNNRKYVFMFIFIILKEESKIFHDLLIHMRLIMS